MAVTLLITILLEVAHSFSIKALYYSRTHNHLPFWVKYIVVKYIVVKYIVVKYINLPARIIGMIAIIIMDLFLAEA